MTQLAARLRLLRQPTTINRTKSPASAELVPALLGSEWHSAIRLVRVMEKNPSPSAAPLAANDATSPTPAHGLIDVPALAAALAGIRADSQRDPETYLQDTVVPSGGE